MCRSVAKTGKVRGGSRGRASSRNSWVNLPTSDLTAWTFTGGGHMWLRIGFYTGRAEHGRKEYTKLENRCRGQRCGAGPLNGQLDDVWTVRALRSWLLDLGFIYKRWLVDRDGELGRPCRFYSELALHRKSLRTRAPEAEGGRQ